jgi:hypothetical protein
MCSVPLLLGVTGWYNCCCWGTEVNPALKVIGANGTGDVRGAPPGRAKS